jgi:hypothetical protein
MIVVRCKGGLGNQLFQYAAARALAARHRVPLKIDARWYAAPENQVKVERTFDLAHLRVAAENATARDLRAFGLTAKSRLERLWGRLRRSVTGRTFWAHHEMGYDFRFGKLGPCTALEGFFQHPEYFAPIAALLPDEFRLKNEPPDAIRTLARGLAAEPSICVQVRRSDYVTHADNAAVHGVCDKSYYEQAWCEIQRRVPGARAWVFTDDAAWAHESLRDLCPARIVQEELGGPAFLYKFHVMQACRHFVLANSTFGWWAAWLGASSNSTVILPRAWTRTRDVDELGLRAAGWIAC